MLTLWGSKPHLDLLGVPSYANLERFFRDEVGALHVVHGNMDAPRGTRQKESPLGVNMALVMVGGDVRQNLEGWEVQRHFGKVGKQGGKQVFPLSLDKRY